jgi:hypothetical protein
MPLSRGKAHTQDGIRGVQMLETHRRKGTCGQVHQCVLRFEISDDFSGISGFFPIFLTEVLCDVSVCVCVCVCVCVLTDHLSVCGGVVSEWMSSTIGLCNKRHI